MNKETVLTIGKSYLNEFQRDVLKECLEKGSGGLSLCLGSGKTLTSLVIGLSSKSKNPMLVVVSKTLLSSWEYEIKKFFGDSLKYQVLHQENCDIENCTINPDTLLVLTTVDIVAKFYKKANIDNFFIKGGDKKEIILTTLKKYLISENYDEQSINLIIDVVCPELIDILVSVDKRKIMIKKRLSCIFPWCS